MFGTFTKRERLMIRTTSDTGKSLLNPQGGLFIFAGLEGGLKERKLIR